MMKPEDMPDADTSRFTVPWFTPRNARIVLAFVWLVTFVHGLGSLYSLYASGRFGFHDVTLINDWFTNAIYHGKPFYVTDYGQNHLVIHWTPTLIVFAPLFALFQSQFLLLAVEVISFYCAVGVFLTLCVILLRRLGFHENRPVSFFLLMTLVVLLGLGTYSRTVLVSAHFETLFILPMAILFLLLLTDCRLLPQLFLTILLLGFRQDAAFFMLFCFMLLFAVPRGALLHRRRTYRNVTVLMVCCVLYAVVEAKVILPNMEFASDTRYWRHLGRTWPDVIRTVLTSPLLCLRLLARSAFVSLTGSLAFLPVFSPIAWIMANAAAFPNFVAEHADKYRLYYYNSAFLLPAFFMSAVLGACNVARIVRFARARRETIGRVLSVLLVFLSLTAIAATCRDLHSVPGSPLDFKWYRFSMKDNRVDVIRDILTRVPAERGVATDFDNIVFVPNRFRKYLLRNYHLADVVFMIHDASHLETGTLAPSEIEDRLRRNPSFDLLYDSPVIRAYGRKGLGADSQAGQGRPE